jgi:hypothetical protein
MTHPSPEALKRFARGTASPDESREVVRHLLRQCLCCSAIVSCAAGGPMFDPDVYEPVFDRVRAPHLQARLAK